MSRIKPLLLYLFVLMVAFVVGPFAAMIGVLPLLLVFSGLLAVLVAVVGGFAGWLAPDTSNRELFEIVFPTVFAMALVAWLYVLFALPRQTLATYSGVAVSRDERLRLKEYVRYLPLTNLMATYAFLAVFFWYLLAQYLFGGSFFAGQPASAWNVTASGLNILSGNWIADYIKDTDVRYTFVAIDETKLRNKLMVTVTQGVVLVGLLTSAAGVLKLNDAAFGIRIEGEKEKDGS